MEDLRNCREYSCRRWWRIESVEGNQDSCPLWTYQARREYECEDERVRATQRGYCRKGSHNLASVYQTATPFFKMKISQMYIDQVPDRNI